jgi:hypothetical protein
MRLNLYQGRGLKIHPQQALWVAQDIAQLSFPRALMGNMYPSPCGKRMTKKKPHMAHNIPTY